MKKGFTLIELLAVIVILAIIALIATPIILGIIEDARVGSIEASAKGYLKAVKYELASLELEDQEISDGTYNVIELENMGVKIKGNKPKKGTVVITNGEITDCTLMIDKYTIKCLGNGKISTKLSNNILFNNNIVYSWHGEYYTGFLKDETFELFDELNITTIYHSFKNLYLNKEELIADNILNNGYDVYHLTGDLSWYNDFDSIKVEIDNVYNYNVRKTKKIKGLVLDVEFYLTDEYETNPDDVISQLLNTYNEVITYAHNKNLEIIFCLPFWLDSKFPTELEEIIKISDGISIMNYNQKVLLKGITNEVEMARKYNKKISNIAEFDDLDEDYLTYNDDGFDKAFEDWEMLEEELKYNNLSFAFHHLNNLLEIKKGHKTYKYIVKDSNKDIKVDERIYINVKSGDDVIHFIKESDSEGIVSITLPKDNNYDIQVLLQDNDISSINNISSTQTLNENEIIIGNKKEKYTIEYYFHLLDNDGNINDFKNKKVIIYSKDTGEKFIRTTSNTYGHIAVKLNYQETYYIEIFDGNDYLISINNEDFNSNITNEFNYPKSDDSYFGDDVYIKMK